VALRVPGILLVAGLEGERRVDEVAIDMVELQPAETGVKGRLNPLRTMVIVPQLRGDKDVLSPDLAGWRCHASADDQIWVQERLFLRLQLLAKAYELHLLPITNLTAGTRFNGLECGAILEALDFLATVTHDPLISALLNRMSPAIQRCAQNPRSTEVLIEGP